MNNTGNDINRSNYEAFFLLFIDNELMPEQREALNEFLLLNPDLENELQVLLQYTLKPDRSITFKDKETLMHFTVEETIIHSGNIENYFILYADNELTNTQKASVEAFVYHNPRYQSEFELIQSARVAPDPTIIFEGREKLFRHESTAGTIPLYRRWQFAAACIFLLCGSIWLSRQDFISTIPETKFTHGGQAKKPLEINRQPQQAVAAGKTPAKTVQAVNEKKLAAHVKPGANKDKKIIPDNARTINKSINPGNAKTIVFTGKLIRPATAKEIKMPVPDELKPVEVEYPDKQTASTDYNETPEIRDGQVLFVNDRPDHSPVLPFNKKQLLRGILRKTTRFLDHQSNLRNAEPGGLRVGNIEISIQ